MPRTVLVTGCSSGFGKLIAQTFAQNEWNVIATMRSPEKEKELQNSDRMLILRLGVTDLSSISNAFREGLSKFNKIDVVVNNAGYGGFGLFEQVSDSDVREMFDTNVFGPMNVMRAVLPAMREAGAGTIINVTSMAGHIGLPGNAVYSASKHAVIGLTEGMALEYEPLGVRIFSVAPGAYPTTRFDESTDKRLDVGDDQLVSWSNRLRDRISAVGEQMASEGGSLADPQEVADRVFACATSDMPINNPTGSDAEMLMAMMGQDRRQVFLDEIAAMLVPSTDQTGA